jgi:hypothetical protein
MALTPDIQRAHALVEVAALLKKADIIRERHLRDMEIHVSGWVDGQPGSIATVRPRTFCEGVTLEPVK